MTDIYHRYAYDETGTNPDNAVWNEPHTLSTREIRAVVPKHGPFYSDSIQIMDTVNNRILTKRTIDNPTGDFSIPVISQELVLRLGKDVADALLIENPQVSDQILVSYQSVGGLMQRDIGNVVDMFEAFVNDNRMVDWATGLFGKPHEYPPAPHPHYLTDIFGFEALSFVLERIYQAILMGNTPAYEMLYEALKQNRATKEDIDQGLINNKMVPLDVLQHATKLYNFNTISMTPMEGFAGNGRRVRLEVKCSNAPRIDKLYWSIEHVTTEYNDFVENTGSFDLIKGEGSFYVQTAATLDPEEEETFRICLRRGGPDRYVLLTSFEFKIPAHTSMHKNRIFDALRVSCLVSPRLRRTGKTINVNRAVWKAQQS